MKKITVVIPCKDDPLIIRCVASINEKHNIVIVFNGSSNEFIRETKNNLFHRKNIKYVVLKEANLSWALESGTRASETDLILYLYSDCVFEKNAIDSFSSAVRKPYEEVYKGEVVFAAGKNFIENVIAKSRTHHTAEVLTAYKPPLLISKKILEKIGGYAFDRRLIWREDSDLDNRIRVAGIKIISVPKGVIYHKSIDLKTDLRSTFRYGTGLAIANALKIRLTEVPRSVWSTFKSQGLLPALYMIFRNRVYDLGYWFTRLKILTGYYRLSNSPDTQHD